MANNDFVKTAIRHPLAVGIICTVVAAVLEQWVGPWQILGLIWGLTWNDIANIPTWIWYGGGLICALIGGFVVALLITRPHHRRQRLSNMAGITTPVLSMSGTPLDGCVAFFRLDQPFSFYNPPRIAKVYEAVIKVDSYAATRLKELMPRKSFDYVPSVQPHIRLAVRDITADTGYILQEGACLDCRDRDSDHIGFIFAFVEERVI